MLTRVARLRAGSLALGLTAFLSGCLVNGNSRTNGALTTTTSASPTPTPTYSPAGGAKAVRIVFRQAYPAGSFDAPPPTGTAPAVGSGHKATRLFNADGSLLANGTSDPKWPSWFTSFEIGVSGTTNTAAPNANCARFAAAGEDTANTCKYAFPAVGAASASTACGAQGTYFRVSEYDCAIGATSPGVGGPNDGVYFRAAFNRSTDVFASGENLLVTVEYIASGLNKSPAVPTQCFSGGVLMPENCSDMTWKAFIKHSASEIVQPFLLLVPPVSGAVDPFLPSGTGSSGSGISTRQFVIPMAGDSTLSVLQLSRIKGLPSSATNFSGTCSPTSASGPGNSPLCVGVVFHAITFFRI